MGRQRLASVVAATGFMRGMRLRSRPTRPRSSCGYPSWRTGAKYDPIIGGQIDDGPTKAPQRESTARAKAAGKHVTDGFVLAQGFTVTILNGLVRAGLA